MRNKVRPKRLTVNTKYADANAVGYTEFSIRITNSYTSWSWTYQMTRVRRHIISCSGILHNALNASHDQTMYSQLNPMLDEIC